ncbi:hypothetical protein ACJX0J_022854, partial [Zea mays]
MFGPWKTALDITFWIYLHDFIHTVHFFFKVALPHLFDLYINTSYMHVHNVGILYYDYL